MKIRYKKALASLAVGASLGATAVVFLAPTAGGSSVRFTGCDRLDDAIAAHPGLERASDKRPQLFDRVAAILDAHGRC